MNYQYIQYLSGAIWLISLSISLIWIKRSNLDNPSKALWTFTVLLFPYLGSLAFIIVHRLSSRIPLNNTES